MRYGILATISASRLAAMAVESPPEEPAAHVGSRIRIVDATQDDPASWDALAVRSPRGEAFQSHAWSEHKRRAGWTARRYRMEDSDGPIAVVSLQERDVLDSVVRRIPGPLARHSHLPALAGRLLYAPTGPVLLREDQASVSLAIRSLRQIARVRRAALMVVDPNWERDGALADGLNDGGFSPSHRQVQVSTTGMQVRLQPDDDSQRRLLNENARRNLTRARKAGVTIIRLDEWSRAGDLDAALGSAYQMWLEIGERKGFAQHLRAAEHHTSAQRDLVRSGVATIWLARHEGVDVAHAAVYRCGRRAFMFQAGEGAAQQKRVPANFLLQWSIIRWAAGAGFDVYDMGGVDNHQAPGIPRDEAHPMWSVFRFKVQWGARPVQFCGPHEYAPWPLLGGSLRAAWRLRDAVRRG